MFKKKIDIIIIAIFIFGAIYLYSHLLIMQGHIKERQSKECVGAVAILSWERTLNITEEICVNGFERQRIDHENKIRKLEEDIKYWRDSYFWLKKQNENDKKELDKQF